MVLLRKSQTEIIGLVIIVALLAFILIFVLVINSKQDSSLKNDYLQLNADNLRSTLLKADACKDYSIKDEIIICNEFQNSNCFSDCDKVNNLIKKIIENSLKNNYKFEAGNIKLSKGSCLEKITASKQPLPYSNVEVSLELC